MFLVNWWQGQPIQVNPYEQLAKRLVQEIRAHPRFQRCRLEADLGYRFRFMIAECKRRVERMSTAKGLKLRKRRAIEMFDFLVQDEGRQFVRSYCNYSRALFGKLVEFRERLPLPLHMRQLFPSAPPLAQCTEWDASFCELP